jgi:predicted RNase H-like HicB family nuclease
MTAKAQGQQRPQYTLLIEWSNLDDTYVVSFPEWERAGYIVNIHGATYTKAAQRGEEMLAALIEGAQTEGKRLPAPALFDDHAYAPGATAESIARENATLADGLDIHADAPAI